MMIVVNDKDISELISKVTWSGDRNQAARKLDITYAYDVESGNVPAVEIVPGDLVQFKWDDGKELLYGTIYKVSSQTSSVTRTFSSYDFLWFTLRNKTFRTYEGAPESITGQVCGEFGIPIGTLQSAKVNAAIVSTGNKSIYQVITEAYSVDDKKHHVYMTGDKLCVEAYGAEVVGVLTGDSNSTDLKFESSIENMVNRVIILDDKGNQTGQVQNEEDLKYGLMQETYKVQKDTDSGSEARKLLQRIANAGTVTAIGNPLCVTGKAVYIKDVSSNVTGKFTIISDTHEITNGSYMMSLGLDFDEVV